MLCPPALILTTLVRRREKEKGEVLHLFRCYTHTPSRSRDNPERQEEEKSGHKRRAKGQNSAGGGEGNRRTSRTNLHGETDLTSTGHTSKPHNTLQRGTGEELGTDGGLVGDEGKTTRTIKLKGPSSTLDNRALSPKRDHGQVQPHGHKRLFKVRRIRRTTCSTSPETKVTTPAGKRHAWCLQLYITPKAALQKKKTVSGSSERLHVRRVGIGEGHKHGRSSGISKKADKRKANCSTLLPRITRLKMSIPTSSQSTLAHNGVASYGPMAPCRSHHRNHTRQNWIF